MVAISLFTPAPTPEIEGLLWRPRLWQEKTEELKQKPWYANYRYLAVGLTILIVIMVVWWW